MLKQLLAFQYLFSERQQLLKGVFQADGIRIPSQGLRIQIERVKACLMQE